ncbi:hypothetical protein AVEN_25869-1, partial [Araneus ventricosus]
IGNVPLLLPGES